MFFGTFESEKFYIELCFAMFACQTFMVSEMILSCTFLHVATITSFTLLFFCIPHLRNSSFTYNVHIIVMALRILSVIVSTDTTADKFQ